MQRLLAALAALLAAAPARPASAQPGEDPRAVVGQATRAVWGDSVARVRARWEARLRRDSADRAAALGLATLARLTYDYDGAERLYRRLFADSLLPDRFTAFAHLGLARQLERRGFGVQAPLQFDRARHVASTLGDATTEGEALLFLAFVRGRTDGLTAAEATLDTAERLIPDTLLALHALSRNRRAVLLSLRGQGGAAEAAAESSIALARRAGDSGVEADCYRALGQVLVQHERYDSAMVVLRRAEDLYRRARDRGALAANLVWRAQALNNLGRYGEMREAMRLALAEGQAANNPVAVATAHRSLGALGIALRDFAAAGEHLRKAMAIARETGNEMSASVSGKFLSQVSLAAGDTAEARRLTLEHLEFARRSGDRSEEHEAHVALAALAIRERNWAAAERALADARSVIGGLPSAGHRLWLLHHEGRLRHVRGDLAAAERAFTAFVRGDSARSLAGDSRFDTRVRLADIYAAGGDLARAEREMVAASDDLDAWRAGLGDAELRVLAFQVNPSQLGAAVEPTELDARIARVLAALAAGGRAEAAFALAERRRARELRDRLVRAEALRTDTGGRRPTMERAPDSPARVTAAAIAGQLPDGRTALLEFVGGAGGSPVTVFVVQRHGLRARLLPSVDSLGARVARLVALLEAGADADAPARSLGAALLQPALGDLGPGVTRLIIVPDGPLHYVPWDALRLADGDFAAERYAVSIAPSAAVVTTLWQRRASSGDRPVRLLAFGDPVFPGERAGRGAGATSVAAEVYRAETYRSAFDSAGGLPRLKASAREARLVARYAPEAEVRLREEASAAFLKRALLRDYRIIHLATHALVDDRSVARTALALAPGGGESGFVGAGDLAVLPLGADLVVLSACRTARGRLVEGEGIQGLTAPLLEAGARSVVATGWRIGDRSTVAFVDAFYGALAQGLAISEALRAAKLDAIRRGAPPREWAAFTLVGDPLVTVPLRQPPSAWRRWWPAALAALAIALAAVGFFTRRRRIGDVR